MIAVAADAERKEKYRLAMIEVRSRPEVQAKRSASLSAALKGKRPSRATIEAREKPVQCIETKMVFRSVAQAIQWLKDSGRHRAVHTGVSMCCKGSQKTAYGYTWRFAA